MIPIIKHPGKGTNMETAKRSVVARGAGGQTWISRVWRIFRAVKILCMIL